MAKEIAFHIEQEKLSQLGVPDDDIAFVTERAKVVAQEMSKWFNEYFERTKKALDMDILPLQVAIAAFLGLGFYVDGFTHVINKDSLDIWKTITSAQGSAIVNDTTDRPS